MPPITKSHTFETKLLDGLIKHQGLNGLNLSEQKRSNETKDTTFPTFKATFLLVALTLSKGETFRLLLDRNWKDAYGNPLEKGFQKEFKVAADDRGRVSEKEWRVTTPSAGTRQPLILNFPDPLDHALLSRMILIVDTNGNSFKGTIEISKSEMRWEFIPDSPWASGNYFVAVNTALEDLAGNNLNSVFDRELAHSRPQIETGGLAKIHFQVTKH